MFVYTDERLNIDDVFFLVCSPICHHQRISETCDPISKKGEYAKGEGGSCLVHFEKCIQHFSLGWILVTPIDELLAANTTEHLFRDFPDAEACSRLNKAESTDHPHSEAFEFTSMCWYALAYEKVGMLEKCIEFATVGLWTDFERGGVRVRWAKSICHSCIGRVLRKQGKLGEAALSFERAFAACDGVYNFYEALALRDHITVVPAGSAKAKELAVRFTEAMAKLGHDNKELMESRIATCFVF